MQNPEVPAIELRQLQKRFGALVANAGIDLRIQRGSLHGIIGENGAGKSTAMKLLYGIYQPDGGEIFVQGQRRVWSSPSQAIACGLGMVHQHFMLAGPHSALDNILLGAEPVRWGVLQRRRARARLEALADQYQLAVDWDCPVEQLPVGIQQRVEILKLLYRQAEILILDEPTAVLTPQETKALFANLARLRQEGKTILLVTHKLKEVMAATERVTVFRAGKVAGEVATAQTNPEALASLMVGRKVMLTLDVKPACPRGDAALEVGGLSLEGKAGSRHRLRELSFSVKRGEIVGVAGVEGNGQSELLQAVLNPADRRSRSSGTVKILGEDATAWPARRIRELGVGVIPEDRLREGLLLNWTVAENFILGLQRTAGFLKRGLLSRPAVTEAARKAIAEYDVRPADPEAAVGGLSGGNQQKLIVAREFQRCPRLLIAAQPTRGVDVGAIEFIHRRIVRARDEGAGVLLVSSELDEVLSLSDRILVLYEGRMVAEFHRGAVTERELGLKMGGG